LTENRAVGGRNYTKPDSVKEKMNRQKSIGKNPKRKGQLRKNYENQDVGTDNKKFS